MCARCGQTGAQLEIHDRRVKRRRHLDLGATRCVIECELRRLRCPDCRVVRLGPVPWARPGSSYTRDFEDVGAWLAQPMAKTPIAGLLRIGWNSVGRIVERVIADHLDERRLQGLVAIGVDEISYRRDQRYLTSVADHASGAIVWCAPGRNSATLQAFFAELGERRVSIRAISIDMSGEYQRAIREAIPHAEICFDPFHVCRLQPTRCAAASGTPTSARRRRRGVGSRAPAGRCSKRPSAQTLGQLAPSAKSSRPTSASTEPSCCARVAAALPPRRPAARARTPRAWLAWASRSSCARSPRSLGGSGHREGILAAIRLGLSNGRLEGLTSKIRLVSHRSFGLHSAAAVIAPVYLCCAGVAIELPRSLSPPNRPERRP